MHVRPQLGVGDEPKRFYSTLPGPFRGRERETTPNGRRKEEGSQGGGGVKHSLYQSPHLLLLQGYNRQVSAEVLWSVLARLLCKMELVTIKRYPHENVILV